MTKKIVVAMSGGVDSSTVAAMLKDQGYEVIGITLQLYDHGIFTGKKGACCAGKDIYDAQNAAAKLNIAHYVFDYESSFKEEVIDKFIASYKNGETPIPCILCNQKIKFRDLLKAANQLNATSMATGHYVRKIIQNGKAQLHKGLDQKKDQSYFLFTTTAEQLDFLDFPLGNMTKEETRRMAESYNLIEVANKPESQDICFVPNGNYRDVLKQNDKTVFAPGHIVNSQGKILGQHNGIVNYTIGQRKGLDLKVNQSFANPLYVIAINSVNNEVVVGEKEELKGYKLLVNNINFLCHEFQEIDCTVKLRSTHEGSKARVKMKNNKALVELYEPFLAITPGQACVFYDDSRVLGGGWIEKQCN